MSLFLKCRVQSGPVGDGGKNCIIVDNVLVVGAPLTSTVVTVGSEVYATDPLVSEIVPREALSSMT